MDRCYEAVKLPQFRYIKEILANPKPLSVPFALESDGFALAFSNVLDASIATAHHLAGPEVAKCLAKRGFAEVFSASETPTDLQQALRCTWLCYFATVGKS